MVTFGTAFRAKSTVVVAPSVTATPVATFVAYPYADAVTSYVPTARLMS